MKIFNIFSFMLVAQVAQASSDLTNPRPDILNMDTRVVQGPNVPGTNGFSEVMVPVFTPKNEALFRDAVQKSETIWANLVAKPNNLRSLRMLPVYQNASSLVREALEFQWYVFAIEACYCVSARDWQAMENNAMRLVYRHSFFVLC